MSGKRNILIAAIIVIILFLAGAAGFYFMTVGRLFTLPTRVVPPTQENYVNPFAKPSPQYENPFSEYQNPFEELR